MSKHDAHDAITNKIVSAMEAGAGEWRMPWHGRSAAPVNVTGNEYHGINVLALWIESQVNCFTSNVWGTYNQWNGRGCRIKGGSKASRVFFYTRLVTEEDGEARVQMISRTSSVFNADQVDGYEPPSPVVGEAGVIDSVEAFVSGTGAVIKHEGSAACYVPGLDVIRMPPRESFFATATSSATEAYYSTMLHELVHWSGHESRCGRDLTGRFRTEAYAMEELVAELGAAFLCARLGVAAEPRADHAQYLKSWLNVLKSDKRAVFVAASLANKAVEFLTGAGELTDDV